MKTVICLHASASSPRQWAGFLERLAPRHPRYRIVAPALGGPRPPGTEAAGELDADVAAVARCIEAAGGEAHLVGHSYGAAVALRLAQHDRAPVASVVAYEPVLFSLLDARDPALQEIQRLAAGIKRRIERGETLAATRDFVDYWSGAGSWQALPHPQRHALVQRIESADRQFDALLGCRLRPADFQRVAQPVLLLHGDRTRRPAEAVVRTLFDTLPNVTERAMPSAGHMGPLTHARRFETLVERFLDRIDSPPVPVPARRPAAWRTAQPAWIPLAA